MKLSKATRELVERGDILRTAWGCAIRVTSVIQEYWWVDGEIVDWPEKEMIGKSINSQALRSWYDAEIEKSTSPEDIRRNALMKAAEQLKKAKELLASVGDDYRGKNEKADADRLSDLAGAVGEIMTSIFRKG